MRATVLVLVIAACSRASDESGAKQWADQVPPQDVSIPANLRIELKVGGADRPAITSATLAAIKPDFVDAERKAWLVPTIIAEAKPIGSVVEATSPGGVSVKFAHPTSDGFEPVLFLTRRGEVIVSAVDPKDPFPRFHGQGGRLHRAGDSLPRVAPVARIEITAPAKP
jgi:hypothetical protein